MQSEMHEVELLELSDLIKRGITPKYVEADGICVLNQKCIRDQKVSFEPARETSTVKKIAEEKLLQDYDVLVNSTGVGTLGRVAQIGQFDKIITVDSHVTIVRGDKAKVNLPYFGYLVKNKQKAIESLAEGSTGQTELSRVLLGQIKVAVHKNINEQKKIAHILSTLDDKIELNRKMNQTLEEMAQALFKSWFVNFDPVHAKAGAKSDEEMERAAAEFGVSKEVLELFPGEFEESEMGMIPKGWEVKSLSDVVNFQNGYSFKSKELHQDTNNSTKVFKMGHIHRGGGFKEEGKDTYFYNVDSNKMDKYLLEKGDILMAMTDMKANMALLAHTALMPHTNRYLLNQRAGRLRIKDTEILDYPYVYIFSNYPDTIHDLRSRSNSGVQVNLTTKAILDTEIIVPEQKIHAEFNKVTLVLYEKIFSNNAEIVSLQKTRDTLLPKLLSGELDVSEVKI